MPSSDAPEVTVLTVDDHEPFRAVARDVIEATPGFACVGEAADGQDALEAVDRLAPALVLLDVRMPGLSGVEVARRLTETHPETLVVFVSMAERDDVPAVMELESVVPFVRKQDFCPRALSSVWREHGRRSAVET